MFSVAATDASPRLDPRTLGVRGHPGCLPAVATQDVAVFKIHTAACGARMRVRSLLPWLPLVACRRDDTPLLVLF